ncbi:hypothetical protein Rxycam_02104 [Rubrobacter xylanophilus DSM 9941]|nr:hypothetical protein Rxycam_02104 [Rubrobacter xylanophilus DSM 9941]
MRGRRLVLGYDGGCGACSALVQRIEEAVGDKLEVRSLHEPQVEHWREQALGSDAPWAPTLIEVSGDKARAWTGVWMGPALARRLGPAATWRVMQALGEAGTPSTGVASMEESGGISRGQFLKGLTGGLVALSVLPAGQALASGKEAVNASGVTRVSSRSAAVARLKRSRAVNTAADKFGSPDWSGVTRAKYKDKDGVERAFYTVPYRPAEATAAGATAGVTLLFTEDEGSVEDAQSIALRVRQIGERRATLDYYLPDGTPVATVEEQDGKIKARPAERSSQDSVQPRGVREFVGCFVGCLGSSVGVSCAVACANCVIPPPEPPPCIQCAACAGSAGLRCARLCRPLL